MFATHSLKIDNKKIRDEHSIYVINLPLMGQKGFLIPSRHLEVHKSIILIILQLITVMTFIKNNLQQKLI